MAEHENDKLLGRLGAETWGGLFVGGLLLATAGVIAVLASWISGIVSVIFLGVLLVIAGVLALVHAFRLGSEARALLLLDGLLSIVLGALFLIRPGAGLEALALLLAAFFFVNGLFRLATSVADRYPSWGWDFGYGLLAIGLGVIVVAQWPISALWLVGTLVGVELIFRGGAMIGIAVSLRRALHGAEHALRDAIHGAA